MIAKVVLTAALVAISLALPYKPYRLQPVEEPAAEEKFEPIPYEFGYETNDDEGTTTFRKESSDGKGSVQGSYGYKDLHGIERIVEYVADKHGYKAQIKTNEPGTDSQNPADVVLDAKPIVIEEPKQAAPAQENAAPESKYPAPARYVYSVPEPQYAAPARWVYSAPEQQNEAPAQQENAAPEPQHAAPARWVYSAPQHQNEAPAQQENSAPEPHAAPARWVYSAPEQQSEAPAQQKNSAPEPIAKPARWVYSAPQQQNEAPAEQEKSAPEQQEVAPEQRVYYAPQPHYRIPYYY